MGQLNSVTIGRNRLLKANKAGEKLNIAQELQRESVTSNVEYERPIQLVLYGPGEAGKTTFAHRMMLQHGHDLSSEIDKWRPLVCYNILEGVNLVINNGMKIFRKRFSTEEEKTNAEIVLSRYRAFSHNIMSCNLDDDQELVDAIFFLYDKSVLFKKLVERRSRFALFDSWIYFVEQLRDYPTWGGADWDPNAEDILRARNRSVGAKAFSFVLNDQKYTLTDLGGQKSERVLRLVFSLSLDCLLFFTSLSDYDEVLFEDHTGNRLTDSLRVWKGCVTNPDFKDKTIVLFMNKFDIFQQKYFVEEKPITPKFQYNISPPKVSDEEGDSTCPRAVEWFKELYRNQVPKSKLGDIKIYVTNMFDEENIRRKVERGLTFIKNNMNDI